MTNRDREIDRITMAFIKACPIRRRCLKQHGALYFRAVRYVGEEAVS